MGPHAGPGYGFDAFPERGLTTTSLYDNLNRLTNSANPLGAIAYSYNKLDLVRIVDRLGFTTSFGYDAVRHRTAETNALGWATLYSYCACGALDHIRDAAGTTLRAAFELFDRSAFARAAFGDRVVDFYIHHARIKQPAFNDTATGWEKMRCFERIY